MDERYVTIFNKLIDKLEKVPVEKWKLKEEGRNSSGEFNTQLESFKIRMGRAIKCYQLYYQLEVLFDGQTADLDYISGMDKEIDLKLNKFYNNLGKKYNSFIIGKTEETKKQEDLLYEESVSKLESFLG